jgi:site-specific recombinase XerD
MDHRLQCGNWSSLCEKLLTQLRDLRYNNSTLTNYKRALKRIKKFMESHNCADYSENVGNRYIYQWTAQTKPKPESARFIKAVICRLNDALTGTEYISHHTSASLICPGCFSEQVNCYFDYLRLRGIKESTISLHRRYCFEFLEVLADAGISKLNEIDPKHVHAGFSVSKSKANFHTSVSSFLKFVYLRGYHAADLSVLIPKPRRPKPLPSAYSGDEIQQIFAAIDTSTTVGKRDYAILALAALLGLRRSDICNLTLNSIDFRGKRIRLIQQKTGIPLETEMLPEVEGALISYLKVAEPTSNGDLIFLSGRAPHGPLLAKSVYNIAQKRFRAAGISIAGKKHGTHSLRMSLATQLISEDVPYGVIQKILGQDDPNSTKHYARIDIEKLRRYALDVPPPSGLFAERLSMSEGGGR